MERVNYETALLAHEKGFDVESGHRIDVYETHKGEPYTTSYWDPPKKSILAPLQSVLQKWLREKHNIAVMVSFNDNTTFEYYYFIHTNVSKACSNRICSLPYRGDNYEEVLEKGLFESLKEI